MSVYQAFGRTALEAMACGATAVVPNIGGVWEFVEPRTQRARRGHAEPRGRPVGALGSLVSQPRAAGTPAGQAPCATAERYSATRAALSEYVLFERAHRARFGGLLGQLSHADSSFSASGMT